MQKCQVVFNVGQWRQAAETLRITEEFSRKQKDFAGMASNY
jgi:hypothetical protein